MMEYVIMLTCSHQGPHNIDLYGPVHVPWDITFFALEKNGTMTFWCVQELFSKSKTSLILACL